MFSDDFWSESDHQRKEFAEVTLGSFFRRVAISVQTIFAAKYAPDYPDRDAFGDDVAVPEAFKLGARADDK